ncbi:carboxy terminal-processing peptidase, partial [Escherichia sp. HC-CC]
NEETETGEKFEDNALPWDSIDAATYVPSAAPAQRPLNRLISFRSKSKFLYRFGHLLPEATLMCLCLH